jgi:L-ascorbate metabolism protein UlaG (beta-lactamase superfamily)
MTLGFRIEAGAASVVYATDHEPTQRVSGSGADSLDAVDAVFGPADHQDRKMASFAQDTDLLISDAQYTPEEYPSHVGWGHATTHDALQLALRARARRVALFHHDPERSDEALDQLVGECRHLIVRTGAELECLAAQEGVELFL